jgi:hypothetical protein
MTMSDYVFEKLHTVTIGPAPDGSRFTFKVSCTCHVEGLFLTKQAAEAFKAQHLNNARLNPH